MSEMQITNLATGAKYSVPTTSYPDIKQGELFIRYPGRWPCLLDVLLKTVGGKWDQERGAYSFPNSYPSSLVRRPFSVYRRRDIGGDECLEIFEDEEDVTPQSKDGAQGEE